MSQRQEAKMATIAALIVAARDLWTRRGWSGVTVRDIAKAAGRSAPLIYADFGSIERLYEAAMGRAPPDPVRFAAFVQGHHRSPIVPITAEEFIRDWKGTAL